MNNQKIFSIAVMPGDGIGTEIMSPCLEVMAAAMQRVGGIEMDFTTIEAGAGCYTKHGDAFPEESRKTATSADAILLGAMGLPSVRYPNGTEIAPQLDLRFDLGLYAGVRPFRAVPGIPMVLADPRAKDIDFVLIRESTEGLFASHGKGTVENDETARETLVITRNVSERLFDFSFDLARQRKAKGGEGRVSCIDKANVFMAFAFFRKIFDERAALNPDIAADHAYIDATALNMVRNPLGFDVMVTENMFGDILSDLGAALIGGMGMAPSADIGDDHAVFQPCHGSAPDIMGQGKANPTAMFMSGAMMLDWLGNSHGVGECNKAAALLNAAIDHAFGAGRLMPFELGGQSGTSPITDAVLAAVDQIDLASL
ncbi:MAG: isocitrate/isopropylmalate dehydrogenase family protein [Rhodospirillales bacterium]|nr:isocitrate/isopropylmalate dehydrogenase family protein [Rhodospirillales bacterium]